MDAANDTPPPLPIGQILAAERERQGLSRADAAQRLHMSAWQVEALENGDYARLPKGTFLRGFVRNYTRLLGLNSAAALDALAHTAPAGPVHGIVVPTQNIRFDPLGERLASPYVKAWVVAGVVIALGFAAMYWWLFIRPAPPAAAMARKDAVQQASASRNLPAAPVPRNLAAAPVPEPEPIVTREAPKEEVPPKAETPAAPRAAPVAKAAAVAPPAEAKSREVAARSPESEVPRPKKPADVVSTVEPAQDSRPAPGARTVRLRFKGSSWVEIRDRSGKVLLSKLNEAGSETEVSGRPPFQVIVGNAPDVTMLYDEREFPLEPHTRVAVARFTLE